MAVTQGGVLQPGADIAFTGAVAIASGSISPKIVTYADSGAIAVESHVAVLTKSTAAAMTLLIPTTAQNGTQITIVAGTSAAHVTTCTNGFWAGETGGPFNKVTTAAFIGSSATLIAYNGIWMVVSDQIATVGD